MQIRYNGSMTFGEWLTAQFLEWRMNYEPVKPSVSDWAKFLGVTQQHLSGWMNDKYKPGRSNLEKLAINLGPEVYDAIGMTRPPEPAYITPEELLDKLSPETRDRFIAASIEAANLIREAGLASTSPAAREILRLVFKKYNL